MGLGTLAKGAAAALAWPLASAFVPPKLMTGLTWGKRAHDFSKGKGTAAWLAKKAGLDPTKLTSNLRSTIQKGADLRSRPSGMPEHLGERGFRTRDETSTRDGDGIQKAITGGDVITETAKKYASLNDDQINYIRTQLKGRDPEELRSILAQAKSRIESGEANQMEKDVFALVQEYLVDPTQYTAHGGRIDKALGGRVRDI